MRNRLIKRCITNSIVDIVEEDDGSIETYIMGFCPTCGGYVMQNQNLKEHNNFCPDCGQHLDYGNSNYF